jgi:hypothetical protein
MIFVIVFTIEIVMSVITTYLILRTLILTTILLANREDVDARGGIRA